MTAQQGIAEISAQELRTRKAGSDESAWSDVLNDAEIRNTATYVRRRGRLMMLALNPTTYARLSGLVDGANAPAPQRIVSPPRPVNGSERLDLSHITDPNARVIMDSRLAFRELAQIQPRVENGWHVTVVRWDRPAAVFVPPSWAPQHALEAALEMAHSGD
ncbi:hypothetical protein [Amycolatopsis thermophila]|uniref:Uncharacterized protein n=1 Tax=Amycolatopsis thermophila TaxID=206084 RepID=A0ABU0EMS3_9PSEU|nr:hypothetical protein [Amycolatopsis thermophila]MDQ0376574.1 hypothetical protein [Amycolatopsis thermophila]